MSCGRLGLEEGEARRRKKDKNPKTNVARVKDAMTALNKRQLGPKQAAVHEYKDRY
jgi:hypothetical protein